MRQFVDLERVELILTYRCNSNCSHCLIQPHIYHNETLSVSNVRKITENICKFHNPISIMGFGGEPILAIESCIEMLKVAKKYQIPHRQILSNGYWVKNLNKNNIKNIKRIGHRLADAGLNSIKISVDFFHQENIPIEIPLEVGKVLDMLDVSEVEFSPRWIGGKDVENIYNTKTKDYLSKVKDEALKIDEGDVIQKRGNALKELSAYFKPIKITGDEKCPLLDEDFEGNVSKNESSHSLLNIKNICISPTGDVIVGKNIIIGNAISEDLTDILANYNPFEFPDLAAIIRKGLRGLMDLGEKEGIKLPKGPFYSVCDACLKWRKSLGFSNACKS